jgi:hypothetical protein
MRPAAYVFARRRENLREENLWEAERAPVA